MLGTFCNELQNVGYLRENWRPRDLSNSHVSCIREKQLFDVFNDILAISLVVMGTPNDRSWDSRYDSSGNSYLLEKIND